MASDDSLVITGVPCTNAATEDEASGTWTCEPGGIVAYRVDLASGSSTELELPEAVTKAGTTMSGLPMGLFRSGTEVVLIAATSADPTLAAWRLDRSDRWVVAEAPMVMPCQVGNEIVEPSGARPDRSEGHGMAMSTPSARVFDPHSSRWGPGVTGLTLSSASDAPPTTVCTRTRLVEVPHGGPGAPTAASFDPKEHAWRSLTLLEGKGVPAPIAHPGLDHVVVFRIGADPAGPAISLDPATGATEEVPLHLDSTATLVALSPSSALVIGRDGSSQVTPL